MLSIAEFSQHAAELIPSLKTPEFAHAMASYLRQLVPIDNLVIIRYPSKGLPVVEYNDPPANKARSTIEHFTRGAFLLDPYYLAATREQQQGFMRLEELAPTGFHQSEYYRTYYKSSGLTDECGYLIPLGSSYRYFVNISVGRTHSDTPFTAAQLDTLKQVTPFIAACVGAQWQPSALETGTHQDLRAQLETALDCFGSSLLTERESQMVKMILQGYSTKAISAKFNIAIETVKLHRKNAYAKLDIGSQGELFHLFIDSLMSIDHYEGGDPLLPYQQT